MGEDLGYFGPGSMTWRIMSDPAVGIGGVRALFLQTLHPLAMAGVHQHSDFREDFWPRLQRTAIYVNTIAFGSTQEADDIAARVRALHTRVRGVDPVTRRPYAAEDPELLRWVHVTEVSSLLDTVRRGGARLSDAEADEYLGEQVRAARIVGAVDVPATRAEVDEYFREMRPQLRSSGLSRQAAVHLATPPMPWRIQLTTPARPAWTALAALAFALLPRWARRCYGLPGLPSTDLTATMSLRAVRAVIAQAPPTWWQSPMARTAFLRAELATGVGSG